MHLTNEIYSRLQQVFIENDLTINLESNHVVVENSEGLIEKIRTIVKSIGFCPLLGKSEFNNNIIFTIASPEIPDFFKNVFYENKKNSDYFDFNEISKLLEESKFTGRQGNRSIKDPWAKINCFRFFVSSALNQGLSEIISKHVKDGYPIVEIGSSIGYAIEDKLSQKTIRIQPSTAECLLLKETITAPIYQLDIEGLFNNLIESGKKIPLFFALNVFDVISPKKRKACLSQLSQLQNSGDHILIIHDTNPLLDKIITQLETLYPEHAFFPYFPLSWACEKFSMIPVPLKYAKKPSFKQLLTVIENESMAIEMKHVSQLQKGLHILQQALNLKVICLEDFFINQIQNELKEMGYTSKMYYHASFTTGEPPQALCEVKQDLIYKPVTDTRTVRQWSLTDSNLLSQLEKKDIHLPNQFSNEFLLDLREKGHKIFGAEILVIEAQKN